MEERRKSQRLERNMPARYKTGNKNQIDQKIQNVKSENISTGGLKLITSRQMEIGTEVNIEISVEGSLKPFYARGEVIWVNQILAQEAKKFEVGIKFKRVMSKKDLVDF
ncbi:MAG: PilZ domain-containing protein [Candidatus Omnitrophota bacterium]